MPPRMRISKRKRFFEDPTFDTDLLCPDDITLATFINQIKRRKLHLIHARPAVPLTNIAHSPENALPVQISEAGPSKMNAGFHGSNTLSNTQCLESSFGSTAKKKGTSKRKQFFSNLSLDADSLYPDNIKLGTLFSQIKKHRKGMMLHGPSVPILNAELSAPIVSFTPSGQSSYQKTCADIVVNYRDCGDDSCICIYCSACFWLNEALSHSLKSKNSCPIYTSCCQKGRVKLPHSRPTPPFLQSLLDPNNGRTSTLFRENIRVYNSMFAFTSMGANIIKDINQGSGP